MKEEDEKINVKSPIKNQQMLSGAIYRSTTKTDYRSIHTPTITPPTSP